ncbi:hypothetical protein FRC11_004533 [Ceratobasidium sp. 423]|nr:hypothetical protein FRC11_004533 [Ceratobasidium sp. 423]
MQRCIDLASAVEYLHDKGVIHGDIKADIPVSDSGDVQLADFGNANLVEHITLIFTRTSPLPAYRVRFTVCPPPSNTLITADSWGNEPKAPEILDDTIQQHTAESDIYALGMQILTGKIPYAEDSDRRALANVYRGILPPRPKLDDILRSRGAEDKLWGLLKRCWENAPTLRPTATEVKQTLIEIKRESSTRSSD